MIINYIKLALRVLGRNKFFTFITLFGISFTLMILMVLTSFIESELGSNAPISQKSKMVILDQLTLRKEFFDTIPKIDSTFLDGKYVYDTTMQIDRVGQSMSSSNFSEKFLIKHLAKLENTSSHTFISLDASFDAYVNNSKIRMDVAYTDHHYWTVFDHKFLEGRGFDETAVTNGEMVAVISEDLASKYFGVKGNLTGKEIAFDGKTYKVLGVVKQPHASLPHVQKDIYVPNTTKSEPNAERSLSDYFGGYSAVIVGQTRQSIANIKDQIAFLEDNIPMPMEDGVTRYDILEMKPKTFDEYYARRIFGNDDVERGKRVMYAILGSLFLLFITLPSLNLVNINVSRILERSSEIGVRKSFGASKQDILLQFITENIVQTLIGGFIGFAMAMLVIKFINDSAVLQNAKLTINPNFVIGCILLTIVFGIVSALIPAYKMSKIHIVNALKSKQL